MSVNVLRLLWDYLLRTLGAWALLTLAHMMQVTAFWAAHVDRLPWLGVFIASLASFVAFESPHRVLKTLPLPRSDLALFRWWTSIGLPALFIAACTAVAWLTSGDNGWARPSQADAMFQVLASWGVLSVLSVLPLPARSERGGRAMFGLVWAVLGALAFYGLPPVGTLVAVFAIALGLASYIRSWLGLTTTLPLPSIPWFTSRRTSNLRGWSVLAADIARSTAFLSIVALLAVSIVRAVYPILNGSLPLVWLFVSAVAVAACLLTGRWMNAVRSLRMLPIGDHRLALTLYVLLMAPGTLTCLVATLAWHVWPVVGIDVPIHMFVIFLLAPTALIPWHRNRYGAGAVLNSIQQWEPLLRQTAWPMWGGALCAFGGPQLMPTWFAALLTVVAIGFAIAGYAALIAGIRSADGFERGSGPLGVAS